MISEVEGSLFRSYGLSGHVGEHLPIPAQAYCINLCTLVYLDSHALGPVLHGQV